MPGLCLELDTAAATAVASSPESTWANTASPTSTTSTLSALSINTVRPRAGSASRSRSRSRSASPSDQDVAPGAAGRASPRDEDSGGKSKSDSHAKPRSGPGPGRPSLLCPPATIISPPSPIEPPAFSFSTPPSLHSPPVSDRTASSSRLASPPLGSGYGSGQEWTSGGWGWSTPPRSGTLSRTDADGAGMAGMGLSHSPRLMSPARTGPGSDDPGAGLLPPDSPNLSGRDSGSGNGKGEHSGSSATATYTPRRDSLAVPEPDTPGSCSGSGTGPGHTDPFTTPPHHHGGSQNHSRPTSPFPSPGLPTPSSPHHYPRRLSHTGRRESSTHRVRETANGQQRSTEDGETMVNQYRIGKHLGKGGFAKVELAVDVGTGIEYAIKEFSQSRLHTQSLQEKQRLSMRGRMRGMGRGRGAPPRGSAVRRTSGEKRSRSHSGSSGSDGEREGHSARGDAEGKSTGAVGRNGPWGGDETVEGDPLGLIRREIAVMKKLDHPNVVLLYEAISVPNADALFLVLEYMPGGVLMSVHLGDQPTSPPFPVEQSREYFRQLVLGLEYLHANGVVHRDIKPDNILLSADRSIVKLCDFGVSEMFVVGNADDRIKKSGGSPAFLSPESFTSHSHEVHGKLVDIWALGVTLYCMFTGSLPFNTENPIELFEMVQADDPKIPDEWDPDQKDLIRQMLRKEPTFRIHMFLLREHPWVTEHGANPMITTDDNLYHVGSFVEEPTAEELKSAIGALRGVFTVIRAVQKMRRLQLARRSISSASPPVRNSTMDSVESSAFSLNSGGSMDSYVSDQPTEDTSTEGAGESTWRDIVKDHKGDVRDEGERERKRVGSPKAMTRDDEVEEETSPDPERNQSRQPGSKRDASPGDTTAPPSIDKLKISTGTSNSPGSAASPRRQADEDKGADVQIMDSPMEDAAADDEVQTCDSPIDSEPQDGDEEVQMVDSPIDDDEVQMTDSPVDEEAEPAAVKIKGRPRPRSRS